MRLKSTSPTAKSTSWGYRTTTSLYPAYSQVVNLTFFDVQLKGSPGQTGSVGPAGPQGEKGKKIIAVVVCYLEHKP